MGSATDTVMPILRFDFSPETHLAGNLDFEVLGYGWATTHPSEARKSNPGDGKVFKLRAKVLRSKGTYQRPKRGSQLLAVEVRSAHLQAPRRRVKNAVPQSLVAVHD